MYVTHRKLKISFFETDKKKITAKQLFKQMRVEQGKTKKFKVQ